MAFIAATVYIGFKFNYESPQEAIVISSLSSDSQFNFPYKINRFERISNVELFSVENKGQFIQAIKNHEDFLFEYNNVYVFRKNFDYYSITYDKREKGVDVFYAKTESISVKLNDNTYKLYFPTYAIKTFSQNRAELKGSFELLNNFFKDNSNVTLSDNYILYKGKLYNMEFEIKMLLETESGANFVTFVLENE